MGTLERIKQFIDIEGISNRKFEETIGFSNGAFASQLKNKRTIGVDKVENILSAFPALSPEWLLTGEGEMFKKDKLKMYSTGEEYPEQPLDKKQKLEPILNEFTKPQSATRHLKEPNKGIPLITISSLAGYGEGEQQVLDYECDRYVVPIFKGADFLIPVKGSSMYPKYSSGDIVACKKLPVSDIFFQWNKVYVLDTIQGALIKRVKKGADNDHFLIVSENQQYEPFELHRSQIRAVAIVMGVIRLE